MPDAGQYALYRVTPRYLRRLIPGPQLIPKSRDAEDPYIKWHLQSALGIAWLDLWLPESEDANRNPQIGVGGGAVSAHLILILMSIKREKHHSNSYLWMSAAQRWERLKAGGEGANRGQDGRMASLTQWA